jgi:hypothetical protein
MDDQVFPTSFYAHLSFVRSSISLHGVNVERKSRTTYAGKVFFSEAAEAHF